MVEFIYPIGYHRFHKSKTINYQLNRWHSFGYLREENCLEAGRRINKMEDFKRENIRLGEIALAENRLINAAFHYRAAEFFVPASDPDKESIYDRFYDLFYNQAFKDEPLERFTVPFNDSKLPVLRLEPEQTERGVVVIHGGFDSFKEEAYSWAHYLMEKGYQVYIFDGPGRCYL